MVARQIEQAADAERRVHQEPAIGDLRPVPLALGDVVDQGDRALQVVDEVAHRRLAELRHDLAVADGGRPQDERSEEHTSELQSLMRISYAVFCLKKTKERTTHKNT